MKELSIAFRDDEPVWTRQEMKFCEEYLDSVGIANELRGFEENDELLAYVSREKPDLVFLNVFLEGNSGIEIASRINIIDPFCKVVFVTTRLEPALDVYAVDHFYYILKDEFSERLKDLFDKVSNCDAEENKLVFDHNGKQIYCRCRDIIYFERRHRATNIICDNHTLELRVGFDQVEERLEDYYFTRCHYSFIVNLNKVSEYTRTCFIMENGTMVPISRKYIDQTRKRMERWSQNENNARSISGARY